jgi:polyphosphate kinase 2 (PPK2 family)
MNAAAFFRRASVLTALLLAVPTASAGRGGNTTVVAPPAVSQTPNARAVRKADKRIEKYRRHYVARNAETGGVPSAKKVAYEQELAARAGKLGDAIRATGDTRPILVIFEGRDAGGKSGAIRRLMDAFPGAQMMHFGPPDASYTGPWIEPYLAKVPKAGSTPGAAPVAIWDRSYYGRVVFDPYFRQVDDATVARRFADIEAAEAKLKGSVRIVKILVEAGGERTARTLGKREAEAPEKLSDNDYTVFRDRREIGKLFRKAVKRTDHVVPWNVVSFDDRDKGHAEVLDILAKRLL